MEMCIIVNFTSHHMTSQKIDCNFFYANFSFHKTHHFFRVSRQSTMMNVKNNMTNYLLAFNLLNFYYLSTNYKKNLRAIRVAHWNCITNTSIHLLLMWPLLLLLDDDILNQLMWIGMGYGPFDCISIICQSQKR